VICLRKRTDSVDWSAFSVAAASVWNSLADYLNDPDLELDSFRGQLKTCLFAYQQAQRIESISDIMTIRYINLLFNYLFSYLLTY